MAIENQSLSTLDQSVVFENLQLIVQQVNELYPSIESRRGPFFDLVLYFSSVLATANQQNITRVREANSLQAIINDPTLSDPDVVNNVLANWKVVRKAGAAATGTITIVLDTALSLTIPQGFQFVANGISFLSTAAFTSRVSASQVTSSTDRLLVLLPNGNYQFTINGVCSIESLNGNISRGTLFTLQTNLSGSFVKAYAGTDFVGGMSEETNEEVITRFTEGAGLKAWSNRATAMSLITSQAEFANVVGISVLGYGDAEQKRDEHSIFPAGMGGRCTILARTQPNTALTLVSPVTATLVSKVGSLGLWQIAVTRDMAPAFYDIPSITLENFVDISPSFTITSDVRGLDVSGDIYVPDIISGLEATYSRYSTAVVQFSDTITNCTALTPGVATNTYDVLFRSMPLIAELQAFLGERQIISPASDLLILGPVPCFMTTDITVDYQAGQDAPDTDVIANVVTTAINATGFGGRLAASDVSAAVTSVLPLYAAVSSITLDGIIRQIDGTQTPISSSTVLIVPEDAANFVSGRTVQFYQQVSDVTVTLVPVSVITV